MMPTPAQIHYQREMAKKENLATSGSTTRPDATQYELMLGQLAQHKRALKEVQSMERKAEVKATFLDDYRPYIEGVLEADSGEPNEVLTTVMVWAIDSSDLTLAVEIGEYVMEHDLPMPGHYNRDAATTLAEEVAEMAIAHATDAPDDYRHVLDTVMSLTADRDMVDDARAKLHKAIGLVLKDSDKQTALQNLDRALELNKQAGVKKLADKIRKEIGTLPAE